MRTQAKLKLGYYPLALARSEADSQLSAVAQRTGKHSRSLCGNRSGALALTEGCR